MKEWLIMNFLSLASFSGFMSLYLLKMKVKFPNSLATYPWGLGVPWSYILFLLAPILLAYLSVYLLSKMPSDDSIKVEGNDIVPVEGNFLPTYIGMYVIALSLSRGVESILIILFLFILWFRIGSVAYFNPFLSLLGYRYYAVKSQGNKTITVITKSKDLKHADKITDLVRINNYTFFKEDKK